MSAEETEAASIGCTLVVFLWVLTLLGAAMKLPEGMTAGQVARLERLSDERRLALLKRAAIIHESHPGMGWAEAYERAFAMAGFATQQALVE